jgi:hypothetical protein
MDSQPGKRLCVFFYIPAEYSLISHRLKLSVIYFLNKIVFRQFPNITYTVDLHDTTE